MEFHAVATARSDVDGFFASAPSIRGGAALSALLHLAAALALVSFEATPPPDDPAAPIVVEIAMEPPASAPTEIIETVRIPPAQPATAAAARAFRAKLPVGQRVPAVMAPTAAPEPSPAGLNEAAMAAPEAASVPAPAASAAHMVSVAEFGIYVERLHDRIAQHRVYPPQSLRRREEGDVRLRILMGQDGRLLDILNLAEASIHLTRAARLAVESAAPFDPPPASTGGERQRAFDVTVVFRLH